MVESIIAYSLSASAARCWNTLSQTPRLGPSAEATMHLDAIAETLRQVTPRNTGAEPVQHRFDEEPVVPCRYPDVAITARQQVTDPLPLVVSQAVTPHRSAPDSLTTYESSFVQPCNPLNDDTP